MYTYKDFLTGKIKRTRGKFSNWSPPTGPLNVRYAIFANRKGVVCVPKYLLTEETKERISELERKDQSVGGLFY